MGHKPVVNTILSVWQNAFFSPWKIHFPAPYGQNVNQYDPQSNWDSFWRDKSGYQPRNRDEGLDKRLQKQQTFCVFKKWSFLKHEDGWPHTTSVTLLGQFLGVNRFMKKHGLQNMVQWKPLKNVRSVMSLIVLKTMWFWKKFKFRQQHKQEWYVS